MFDCIKRTIASLILLVITTGYTNSLQLQRDYPKSRDKPTSFVMKAVIPQTYANKTNHPSAEEILASYERSLVVMRKKVSFIAELDQW